MHGTQVFPVGEGFGYDILQDGVVIIHQEYDPDLPGFESMSEAEARAKADIVLQRVQA